MLLIFLIQALIYLFFISDTCRYPRGLFLHGRVHEELLTVIHIKTTNYLTTPSKVSGKSDSI